MADETGKVGLAAALRMIGDGLDGAVATKAEAQLALLPVVAGTEVERQAEGGRRGRGRPAGSTNRRTKDLVEYLLGALGYRHPAVLLAEVYSRPVEVLAKELGCEKAHAFRLQMDAAKELMPYLSPKQLAVDLSGQGAFTLVLGQMEDAFRAAGGEGLTIEGIVATDEPSLGEDGQGVEKAGETGKRPTRAVQLAPKREV